MSESKSASVVFTNSSLLAKNAQVTADSAKTAAEVAQEQAITAQKTADGKNRVFRGSDPATVPTSGLQEGDLYFTDNALYTWTGSAWEKTVSDTTGAEIHAKVEAAMQESQKAVADLKSNVEVKVKNLDDEIAKNKIQTGNALSFYKEQYYLSTSYTELTGGSWSDEVPPRKVEGKYVWSRYVTANVGDPTNHQYSDPVCISGLDGEQGPQGPQGVPGPKGADGQTTYVHVAYANSADGKSNFSVNYFPDALYIGVLTDYTQADSTDYTQYTWSRLKGDTGDQGIPGPKGADGRTTYVHFAYANITQLGWEYTDFTLPTQAIIRFGNEDLGKWIYKDLPAGKYTASHDYFGDPAFGQAKAIQVFSDFSVTESSGRAYIGQYTDYTQADSTDPASYRWTKIKGETGPTGATGPKGDTGDTGFFIGTTPPPNPTKGTVWATNDASGNMVSAKTWNGSNWVSTAFTQDLVAGNITASKIVGGTLDVNKITIANAQNIPVSSTVSLGQKLSDIEQDADGLTLTVKNKGQNLLRDTDTVPMWSGDKETVDNFTVVKAVMTWDGDSYDPIAWNNLTTIKPNTDYTLSFWAKADQPADIYSYLYNIGTDTVYMDGSTLSHLTTSYQRFEIHFHTQNFSAGRTVNCLPMRVITKNVAHYIYGCQLEEGTMATAWSPDPEDISALKVTSDKLNAYVRGSNGSKTLAAILSMDPNNSTIGQVVNGQIVAAINTSSDGSVKIDGKTLHITADTKIENAVIKSAMIDSIEADKIKTGTLNADKVDIINLNADKITSGTLNGMTITGSQFVTVSNNSSVLGKNWQTYKVIVKNTGVNIRGDYPDGGMRTDVEASLTADDFFLKSFKHDPVDPSPNDLTKTIDLNVFGAEPYIRLVSDGGGPGKHAATYISSNEITSNEGTLGNWYFTGYKARSNGSLYVANSAGNNFDDNGSVGFQVWGGVGLGRSTIYMPGNDLYVQQGNCGPGLNQPYSQAGKVDVNCGRVISQRANTVSSRLSVKTDITPVAYDRALAAVMGTEMYDYRYTSDESGQHYVSGIIDDVNPDPQYSMDDMLINKERTARIDANLVGYHHVILQELIKKIDELEIKVKSLETRLESKEK